MRESTVEITRYKKTEKNKTREEVIKFQGPGHNDKKSNIHVTGIPNIEGKRQKSFNNG